MGPKNIFGLEEWLVFFRLPMQRTVRQALKKSAYIQGGLVF
jgi:hypothetical protein